MILHYPQLDWQLNPWLTILVLGLLESECINEKTNPCLLDEGVVLGWTLTSIASLMNNTCKTHWSDNSSHHTIHNPPHSKIPRKMLLCRPSCHHQSWSGVPYYTSWRHLSKSPLHTWPIMTHTSCRHRHPSSWVMAHGWRERGRPSTWSPWSWVWVLACEKEIVSSSSEEVHSLHLQSIQLWQSRALETISSQPLLLILCTISKHLESFDIIDSKYNLDGCQWGFYLVSFWKMWNKSTIFTVFSINCYKKLIRYHKILVFSSKYQKLR